MENAIEKKDYIASECNFYQYEVESGILTASGSSNDLDPDDGGTSKDIFGSDVARGW